MTDEMVIEKPQPQPSRFSRSKGLFFLTLIVLIFIAIFSYAYFHLAQENTALSNVVSQLQKQSTSQQKTLLTLNQSVDTLQQSTQKSLALSAQQEQMLSEWRNAQKGDLSKWHMAEAQYLVKLANDSVQFEYNSTLASILLKRAQQIMQGLQDPALLDIQKSLATDITNLDATHPINTSDLYLQLTGLNAQLDKLTLPMSPLDAKQDQATPTTITDTTNTSWWRAGLERSWQALSKIVIVRYNGSNALPLVLPEEKTFLYQNLHAQMESAMWALLHRKADIYQASLQRVDNWVQHYFVQDENAKNVLQQVNQLLAINIQPPAVNFSTTLQLFDNYFAQSGQAYAKQ